MRSLKRTLKLCFLVFIFKMYNFASLNIVGLGRRVTLNYEIKIWIDMTSYLVENLFIDI